MATEKERRVVKLNRIWQEPPELRVVYECPDCGSLEVCDPYQGPAICKGMVLGGTDFPHQAVFMNPVRLADVPTQ